MDFFKRLGTQRQKFKVEFCLRTLTCKAKIKGEISVQIRRGEHKVVSENKVTQSDTGVCNFNQQLLTFQSLTLFYDTAQKVYQQKEGEVRVVVVTPQGEKKLVGSFDIDIAQYVNSTNQHLQIKKQFGNKVKIQLEFKVSIQFLEGANHPSSIENEEIDKAGKKSRITLMKQIPLLFDNKSNHSSQNKQDEGDKNQQFDQQQNKSKRHKSYGVSKQLQNKKEDSSIEQHESKKNIKSKSTEQQNEQIKKLTQLLKDSQQKTKKLQQQKIILENQNLRLNSQNDILKTNQKNADPSRNFYQTEREGMMPIKEDQRIIQLQKEKGELLFNIERLQQKYKKDFSKYQQTVSHYQQQQRQLQQKSKVSIKQLQEELSNQKEQLTKTKTNLNQKNKEIQQLQTNQITIKDKLNIAENNLKQLKLKIGDQLNLANVKGNKATIDILTQLLQ